MSSRKDIEEQFKRVYSFHVIKGAELPKGRTPSGWRGYRPNLWRDLYESCGNDYDCQGQIRMNYRQWESGRLHEVLDRLHNALVRFDPDELRDFHEKYPGVLQLINEFAVIEELRRLDVGGREIR